MEIEATTNSLNFYEKKQVNHSPKYDSIFEWYHLKMWNTAQVQNAVKKGWITQDEFEEITNKNEREVN